jgi:isoleucyl-tRNA synthetase
LLKDTILRSKGAQGHKINFRPAWDCHGLPIEIKALQHAQATNKMDAIDIRKLCRKFALQAIDKQKQSMQKWGLLADYNKPLLTMDPQFEASQLQVLAAMVEKNLIYSAKKPVFYSPSSQTALAEAELEYSDQHVSLSAFIRFKALLSDKIRSKLPDKSKNVCFIAWTTTPWTLPSNKVTRNNTIVICMFLGISCRKGHYLFPCLFFNIEFIFNSSPIKNTIDLFRSSAFP